MAFDSRKTILLIALLLPALNLSAEVYEYEDDDGNIVHGSYVPGHLVHKGYKVYNDNRVLLREVPRQLTDEEVDEIRRMQEIEQEILNKRQHDYSLIRRYTSMADFERKRKGELNDRYDRVDRYTGRVERMADQIDEQEARVVTGSPQETDTRRRLEEMKSTQEYYQSELRRAISEAEEYQQNYDYDYQRLIELLANPELREEAVNCRMGC